MKKEKVIGLKGLRRKTDDKPRYHCENCGCKRYSKCTCTKAVR